MSDACGACVAWQIEGVTADEDETTGGEEIHTQCWLKEAAAPMVDTREKALALLKSQLLGAAQHISSNMTHIQSNSLNCLSFGTAAPMARAPSTPMPLFSRLQMQTKGRKERIWEGEWESTGVTSQ